MSEPGGGLEPSSAGSEPAVVPFDHPGVGNDGLIDRNRPDESQGHNRVRRTTRRLDQPGASSGSRTRCLSIAKRAHVHTCVRGAAESAGVEPTRRVCSAVVEMAASPPVGSPLRGAAKSSPPAARMSSCD